MVGIIKSENKNNNKNKKLFLFGFILILVLFLFINFRNNNPIVILELPFSNNYTQLKDNLKKIIDLDPSNEPTIVEIADVNTLDKSTSIIYSQVENNDIMLVYKDKVIIFRPYKNKIVNVFPVNN